MLRRRSMFIALVLILSVSLRPALAASDDPDPIVVDDPLFGEVLFHFYQAEYVPAMVRLLAAQHENQLDENSEHAELLLGGMYLSYGLHLEAAEIFERLLVDKQQPAVRDRTLFFLAKIWQQRGYLDRSESALKQIGNTLPEKLSGEARLLHAQILIDDARYGEAIGILADWRDRSEWARYADYNLGVALVRNGDLDRAEPILSNLGRMPVSDAETAALRDRANLALGYSLLQAGQPEAAKTSLQRVRLDGPFSNKALLGVGWADAELGNYQSALVPWMELRSRDLLDSAVQESLLAIPYAFAELDAANQAADHYLNAVEAFYEETNRIDQTIGYIESGEIFDRFLEDDPLDSIGWYWQIDDLPEGPESRYLYHLLATHEFQEGLKNYRDLKYLYNNLDSWEQNIGVYETMLETRRDAFYRRQPEAETMLARADIDDMIDRKLELDALIQKIELSNDYLSLASTEEFTQWGKVLALEHAAAVRADVANAEEIHDRIELLKGVLQWRLEKKFIDRMVRMRRDLRRAGEALVDTQGMRREIEETLRNEPSRLDAFGRRIDNLDPRINALRARLDDAIAEQRAFLQSIAVGELRAQQERLKTYTVQARFALAALFDAASNDKEPAQ